MTLLKHPQLDDVQSVPDGSPQESFLRHKGWTEVEPETPAFPEGEPSIDWLAAELEAYALANDVDLQGSTKKQDVLDAIELDAEMKAELDEQQDDNPPPAV